MKSADCHRQNRALFHAAKCLDQAILICKEMNNLGDIRKLAERACNLYQQHGSPESGATVLDKAAKILEQTHPEDALQLYKQAVDVVTVGVVKGAGTDCILTSIFIGRVRNRSKTQRARAPNTLARWLASW